MLATIPSPVDELYAWYCVDLCRTMAWHLGVPATAAFKAATLIHKYVAELPAESVSGHAFTEKDPIYIAAGSLLAVVKVDCLPLRLTNIVTVCDRVSRRRFQPRVAKGVPPIPLIPPTPDETEAMRHAIIAMEWKVLEANAFTAICEYPHTFALTFLRATCKTVRGSPMICPSSTEAVGSEEALSPAAVALTNVVLSLCTDAARSRALVLDTPAPVIAAAALHVGAEKCGTPLRTLCPEWYAALSVTQKELHTAVAQLQSVLSAPVHTGNLLQHAAANRNIAVAPCVPEPTDEELAIRELARKAAKREKKKDKKDKAKAKREGKDKKEKAGKKDRTGDLSS